MLCRNVRVESVTFHAKHYQGSDSLAGLTWLIRLSSLASLLPLVSEQSLLISPFNLVPIFNEANTESKQKWKQTVAYQFWLI